MLANVLFTHNDLDGAGCGIIFSIIHNSGWFDTSEIVHCSNSGKNGINEKVSEFINNNLISDNTDVYFADICPSNSIIKELLNIIPRKNIHIFDHHISAMNVTDVIDGPNIQIVMEDSFGKQESGTSLIYKHFIDSNIHSSPLLDCNGNPNKFIKKLVDTIRSYDTYEWKKTNNIEAKHLQTLFGLLGMDRFCEYYIKQIEKYEGDEQLISSTHMQFVEAKLEKEQNAIDGVTMKDVYPVVIKGYNSVLMFSKANANVSELGYQFLNNNKEFDIFICVNLDYKTFEIRAIRDDINLGKDIAYPIGGGGHPKAAGAPIPEEIVDQIIDKIVDTFYLDIND